MHTKKKQVLSLVTFILAITVTSIVLHGQDNSGSAGAKITEKQKEHSKLYKEYGIGKKLREVAAETTANEAAVIRGIPQRVFSPDAPRFDWNHFFRDLSCDSDAVVIGKVKNQSSQLTADEDFVFTDYDLSIKEILKDNPVAPIQPADDLTVTRPGGIVRLNNKSIRALDESLEPLSIGSCYILFLKHIPSTGSYKAFNSKGSFELSNNRIVKLTKESLPKQLESGQAAKALISEIRTVTAVGCY